MSCLPPLATRDRIIGAVLVVGSGIVQAAALAIAAFATRDAFAALHAREVLARQTVMELAFTGVVAALCLYLSRRQAEGLGQSYAIALRRVIYRQIARLPKSRHEKRRVGALSLRFVGDLSAARLWFGRGLPDVLTATVVLSGAVAILISLNPSLAFAVFAPVGLSIVIMLLLAWHLEKRHQRLRKRRASLAISMIERIAVAPELDLMGRTDKELRALDQQGLALKADAVARRSRTAGLQAILQAGIAVAGLALLWFASQCKVSPATVAASLSVLALIAMPVQDLAAAWDRYCAWSVARAKVQSLLNEPVLSRETTHRQRPVSVRISGADNFYAEAGSVSRLQGSDAGRLARNVAALDHDPGLHITFDDQTRKPRIVYIGDTHIGLQGSLRRSVALGTRKRPDDHRIAAVLTAFNLDDLLEAPRGLDQRIAENGKGLTAGQSLRIDLARAVIAQAELIVISSIRWDADAGREQLLTTLQRLTPATIILAENAQQATSSKS